MSTKQVNIHSPNFSIDAIGHCLHNISTKVALHKIHGDFGTLRNCTPVEVYQ